MDVSHLTYAHVRPVCACAYLVDRCIGSQCAGGGQPGLRTVQQAQSRTGEHRTPRFAAVALRPT
eukprot:41370-Eustigmatos_ZCMA.PRE.1